MCWRGGSAWNDVARQSPAFAFSHSLDGKPNAPSAGRASSRPVLTPPLLACLSDPCSKATHRASAAGGSSEAFEHAVDVGRGHLPLVVEVGDDLAHEAAPQRVGPGGVAQVVHQKGEG